MNGNVILISGGLDSSVLAYDVIARSGKAKNILLKLETEPHTIQMEAELIATCNIFFALKRYYPKKDIRLFLTKIPMFSQNSKLFQNGEPYKENVPYEVPYRNLIYIAYACQIANATKCNHVYIAIHKNDELQHYSDANYPFYRDMVKVLSHYNDVQLKAPYAKITKAELIKHALSINKQQVKELINISVSCYEPTIEKGVIIPCGICPSCVNRKKALQEVGLC